MDLSASATSWASALIFLMASQNRPSHHVARINHHLAAILNGARLRLSATSQVVQTRLSRPVAKANCRLAVMNPVLIGLHSVSVKMKNAAMTHPQVSRMNHLAPLTDSNQK